MGAGTMVPIENNRSAEIGALNVGTEGLEFAKTELQQGGLLSSLVLPLFKHAKHVFAPVETSLSPERAKKFTSAMGDSPTATAPTVAIRIWLANYIAAQWGKGCQLVVEDPWLKPQDMGNPSQRPDNAVTFFSDTGNVYHTPYASDYTEALDVCRIAAQSWNFSIFVISPHATLPGAKSVVSRDYISTLAKHTQAILISAYDHDGYVVWQK